MASFIVDMAREAVAVSFVDSFAPENSRCFDDSGSELDRENVKGFVIVKNPEAKAFPLASVAN